MDHHDRLERVKEQLVEREQDAMVVAGPHDCFYLSGFWATGGSNYPIMVVPADGDPHLFVSPLDEEVAQREAALDVDVPEKGFAAAAKDVVADDADLLVTSSMHVGFYHRLGNGVSLQIDDGLLSDMRAVKDADELDRIRAAYRNAEQALDTVLDMVEPGMTEKDVAAEIEYAMRKNGASGRAFPTIVATQEFSSLPHHPATDTVIEDGPLLFDIGSVVEGYNSDISRIVSLGEPSEQFREVYDIVREAQKAAEDVLSAGTPIADVDAAARDVIAEEGYGDEFIHSTGHGVGIDIHEAPNLSPSTDGALEAGMVVTVEPGIYLRGEFGVRIEDAYHITDDGAERLTQSSRDLEILD